jgi:hypothetical protein
LIAAGKSSFAGFAFDREPVLELSNILVSRFNMQAALGADELIGGYIGCSKAAGE